ncbi:glycosyl transferase family protein [Novispirillum itersonii]|uniref:Anthranilate phosphoribosyltransferase n=1 Tax=Novispirillum itersonii TaxID=189 RepID=A0A7X0DKD3_NOVIT|nr:glycosyl transferase family protein [Novispirillum itersonii]MBB6208833.1 anthranilate phosphoribosyltransferase [Novispirillum itersonii]
MTSTLVPPSGGADHPFAPFVRALGKGPNLSRPLTEAEAEQAFTMILDGQVDPVQLGAFLCLLRVKTETPAELAGMIRGIRSRLVNLPSPRPVVDLDWASWAGKARQEPWYVLAALLLAANGVRVFMHGAEGHTAGRTYTSQALAALGVPVSRTLGHVCADLAARNFAYAPLPVIDSRLDALMALRSLLGVRSPLHTAGRALNIFSAPHQLLSVSHPPYLPVHRETARLLGQPSLAVFKGEGGEAERRPTKPCVVHGLENGREIETEWPVLLPGVVQAKEESLDLTRLPALWSGGWENDYAQLSVTGTVAIVIKLIGRAETVAAAQDMADLWWKNRDKSLYKG